MDLGLVCSHCDALNDIKAQACKLCGHSLRSTGAVASEAVAAAPKSRPPVRSCPRCQTVVPEGFRFCGNCGEKLVVAVEAPEGRTIFFGAMQTPNRAKLILIKGEGLDGIVYHLNAAEHVAGREEGAILFPEDPMLSPRHACFYYEGSSLMVRDEGSTNGVFVRIVDPVPLSPDSRFLVGEQLLQFDACSDETLAPQMDAEGTRFYSSPKRISRFKLIQLLRGGEIGMIYRAPTDSVTLGREGNDINFPDDPYISGQHAQVQASAAGFELVDLGSKNGTFLRIEGSYKLTHGTYLFIGQQLLRVEIT